MGMMALIGGMVLGSPLGSYEDQFIHYGTVDRPDGSFRRMLIDQTSLTQVQPDQPLPEGTTILMETWYSPDNLGTIFVKTKQDGDWLYGSFRPGQPDLSVRTNASCRSCHHPFQDIDSTLTLPLLLASLSTSEPQQAFCDRSGRRPCSPEDYQPNQPS